MDKGPLLSVTKKKAERILTMNYTIYHMAECVVCGHNDITDITVNDSCPGCGRIIKAIDPLALIEAEIMEVEQNIDYFIYGSDKSSDQKANKIKNLKQKTKNLENQYKEYERMIDSLIEEKI